MNQLEKIQKFRVVLSSGNLDICRRAIKVTAFDSSKTGPHVLFFLIRSHGNMKKCQQRVKNNFPKTIPVPKKIKNFPKTYFFNDIFKKFI